MRRSIISLLSVLTLATTAEAQQLPTITLVGSDYAQGEGQVVLAVCNEGSRVPSFETELKYGGQVYRQEFPDGMAGYSSYTRLYRLTDKVRGTEGETIPYTVTVRSDSDERVISGQMTFIGKLEGRRGILVEEATGTWCGNCVRGAVGMELLRQLYPDTFVGVAVHGGGGSHQEPMQSDYYTGFDAAGLAPAFPMATVNRELRNLDPFYGVADLATTGNVTAFEVALGEPMVAALDATAQWADLQESVCVSGTVRFAYADPTHDYRVGFATLENNVHVAGDARYNQTNNLSGQSKGGIWARYESLPSVIPSDSMWYQEVARSTVGFNGVEGSLPAAPQAGVDYAFSQSVPVPQSIAQGKEMDVIVYLIDATAGKVLNAQSIPYTQITDGALMPLYYCGGKWGYLPEGTCTYDLDMNEPYPTMPVRRGEGWATYHPDEETGWVVASTSYYKSPAQSDDWLVTPAIALPQDGKSTLHWRARSTSASYPDGYEVYVSNCSGEPEKMKCDQPVLTIGGEDTAWTEHEVELSRWNGDSVRVAFRNVTTNGEMLWLDDITVDNDSRYEGSGIAPTFLCGGSARGDAPTEIARYTMDGRRINASARGMNIVRMSDGSVRKVVVR